MLSCKDHPNVVSLHLQSVNHHRLLSHLLLLLHGVLAPGGRHVLALEHPPELHHPSVYPESEILDPDHVRVGRTCQGGTVIIDNLVVHYKHLLRILCCFAVLAAVLLPPPSLPILVLVSDPRNIWRGRGFGFLDTRDIIGIGGWTLRVFHRSILVFL